MNTVALAAVGSVVADCMIGCFETFFVAGSLAAVGTVVAVAGIVAAAGSLDTAAAAADAVVDSTDLGTDDVVAVAVFVLICCVDLHPCNFVFLAHAYK